MRSRLPNVVGHDVDRARPAPADRAARAALVLLLAGLGLLSLGPLELGTIRIAGVNLLWWYGGVAAPVCAALVTLAALRARKP